VVRDGANPPVETGGYKMIDVNPEIRTKNTSNWSRAQAKLYSKYPLKITTLFKEDTVQSIILLGRGIFFQAGIYRFFVPIKRNPFRKAL